MKQFQLWLQKISAWQVRIVALSFIVLSIAGGSHMLVNAFAASAGVNAQNMQMPSMTTDNSFSDPIPARITRVQPVIKHVPSKGFQPVGTASAINK